MTILYFTSTGNCLSVAKKINGKPISISKVMRDNKYEFEDEEIGIIFPVYGLAVPPIILEFLEKVKFKCKYLFSVITYGTYSGAVADMLVKKAQENNIEFNYINTLHMKENYLPGFAMENVKLPKKQDEKMQKIVNDILQKKKYIKSDSFFDKFMTWTHIKNYHYKRGEGYSKQFSVKSSCTGCSTCVNICPTKNITIEEGKVTFSDDCLCCLACIQNCPTNAIKMTSEKSETRYRNPEVSLKELIEGNN